MWLFEIPPLALSLVAVYLIVPEDPYMSLCGTTISERDVAMITLPCIYAAHFISENTSFKNYLRSRKALKKLKKVRKAKP